MTYQNFIIDFISDSYGDIFQVLFSDVLHGPKGRHPVPPPVPLAPPLREDEAEAGIRCAEWFHFFKLYTLKSSNTIN